MVKVSCWAYLTGTGPVEASMVHSTMFALSEERHYMTLLVVQMAHMCPDCGNKNKKNNSSDIKN